MPPLPSTRFNLGGDVSDRPTELRRWISACRTALDQCSRNPVTFVAVLHEQIASIPQSLSAPEKEVARKVLDDTCRRIVDLALTDPVAITATGSMLAPIMDARVVRAVAAIDERFASPSLRLRDLAKELAVSDCRLTQLLKDATGRSFGAHVHARRVARARVLLAESTLSVKEIAAHVGYSTTTQLDRHFKKVVRRLPSEYRVAARRWHRRALPVGAHDTQTSTAQVSLTQQQN